MGQFEGIIKLLLENIDLIGTLIGSIIAVLKLTSWGKAKSDALDTVVNVIEKVDSLEIKGSVSAMEGNLNPAAKDALRHAVDKADPKKTPVALAGRILKILLPGKRDLSSDVGRK